VLLFSIHVISCLSLSRPIAQLQPFVLWRFFSDFTYIVVWAVGLDWIDDDVMLDKYL